MMLKFVLAFALALSALFVAPLGASAATLTFKLTGDYTATWQMDSNPTPTGADDADGNVYFLGVPGIDPLYLVFYSTTEGFYGGGMRIGSDPDPTNPVGTTIDLGGEQIYSGLRSAPIFSVGTYVFNFDFLTGDAPLTATTLNISAAPVAATPIPASLALFASALGGIGLIGWRRKRSLAA